MIVDLVSVRSALESDEMFPCFQPLVELRTGRLAGFEILARWKHPELGFTLPKNFISLAEENGLIAILTRQIMRKAFQSAPMLPEPLQLAVNVSPIQLRDFNFPRLIRDAVDGTGYPLNRLMIEITESALVDNLETARKVAVELKAMGCKLALDDFGTGYSSLRHLQALPFDELKVDRSFVDSITHKRESRKIAATVIGLGYSLGMTTVGEGVETEEQADILLWLGCDLGQGWFYGYPLPAERIPDMIAASPRILSARMSSQATEQIVSTLGALPAEQLAQLRAIYLGAPVALCFLDRDLRLVSLNQRYADWNGVPMSAILGRHLEDAVPDVYPIARPFLLRALEGKATLDKEITRPSRTPGEPDVTVLISWQPVFDEAQEVIGISIAIVDITERKLAEKALREKEEDYRSLFEHSPQISWILDKNGNLTEVSSQWMRLTGMSAEQALNLGWLEAVHPDDREPVLKRLREALYTGKLPEAEYRVKTADGKWKWMRSRGAARKGPSGEILRWYGGTEDIDECKELEAELRRNRQRK